MRKWRANHFGSVQGKRKTLGNQGTVRLRGLRPSFLFYDDLLPIVRSMGTDDYKRLRMTIDTAIIYHAKCADGFGAAWAAWLKYGDTATYIPAEHGSEPPQNLEDKDVIIADFSYKRQKLLDFKNRVKSLVVLDHHETAFKDLDGLDFAQFDMKRSGAALMWDYLNPNIKRPALIDYIQDRDLWNWKLPNSQEILATFECEPFDFNVLTAFNRRLENEQDRKKIANQGHGILKFKEQRIEHLIEKAYLVDMSAIMNSDDITWQVPCLNSPVFQSELGNLLCQKAPFAIIWYRNAEGKYVHSLRSNGKVDVSKIAEFFGGGGHVPAAGFTIDYCLPRLDMKK